MIEWIERIVCSAAAQSIVFVFVFVFVFWAGYSARTFQLQILEMRDHAKILYCR